MHSHNLTVIALLLHWTIGRILINDDKPASRAVVWATQHHPGVCLFEDLASWIRENNVSNPSFKAFIIWCQISTDWIKMLNEFYVQFGLKINCLSVFYCSKWNKTVKWTFPLIKMRMMIVQLLTFEVFVCLWSQSQISTWADNEDFYLLLCLYIIILK